MICQKTNKMRICNYRYDLTKYTIPLSKSSRNYKLDINLTVSEPFARILKKKNLILRIKGSIRK